MARFDGRAVLITGANSGIGAAAARAFASEGARLVLSGIDAAAGAAVTDHIIRAGGDARFVHGDLTDAGFREGLVGRAVDALGRLDVLVNNAGVFRGGGADETCDADYRLVMTVNLEAVFCLSRAAVRVMKAQGGGVIVNTASELGHVATRGAVPYCASKGGVVQLTRAMALDHARDNIRVNAICPGPVDTALLRGHRDDPEAEIELIAAETPMDRIGEPDEIARAILFAASDEASFMTGASLIVDGGVTAG